MRSFYANGSEKIKNWRERVDIDEPMSHYFHICCHLCMRDKTRTRLRAGFCVLVDQISAAGGNPLATIIQGELCANLGNTIMCYLLD